MPQPTIDAETCIACGACVGVCPCLVYRRTKDGVEVHPEHADWCFACGQCMAVCPTEATRVAGFDYAHFPPLPGGVADPAALEALFLSRRSVRRFTEEPVSPEALGDIVRLSAMAPFGVPPTDVEVTVFGTRGQIEAILPAVYTGMEQFMQALKNPIYRFLIRRQMGAEMFDALVEHLLPLIPPMCRMYRDTGFDAATWGAPAMLLFHHAKRSVSGKENCYVACTYAMLAAQALGLGTTMIGIMAGVIDMDKALRAELGIPDGNQCEISLILGHPAASYRRAIPRAHKTVTWVEQPPRA
ncbi:MAG: 4Fe-4S dicluster domain-containing protein [Armatimonadetes bacterium]|nr:4Fe-4S dicluster domain-containing protein [Armatimonadota bacterium]